MNGYSRTKEAFEERAEIDYEIWRKQLYSKTNPATTTTKEVKKVVIDNIVYDKKYIRKQKALLEEMKAAEETKKKIEEMKQKYKHIKSKVASGIKRAVPNEKKRESI